MEIVDVAIIGGGVAGVGCAAMLPDSLSLILLERETQCGYHATGRSAAAWIAGYGGPEIRVLTRNSEHYLSNPPASLGEENFLSPRGEMLVASSEVEQQALHEQIASTDQLANITIDEACDRVPILNREYLTAAAYTEEAYDIDADRLLQVWLHKIRQRGVSILLGQAVTALQRTNGYWQVTRQDGTVLRARSIVNAAGAWSDDIAELAGLSPLGLVPHRRSAALLPALPQYNVNTWPLVAAADESWYARPMSGKLMVSPADETPVAPHDAFAEDLTIAEGINRFEQASTISVERIETTWAGLRTFAPDRVPTVGMDPRTTGFYWLAGQGGYGIQTAPELSRLAAAIVSGRSVTALEDALLMKLHPARLITT